MRPKFRALQESFDALRARLSTDPEGIEPEKVLVLETIGDVADFIAAVRRIEGMEWLAEIDEEDLPPDDDFFDVNKRGERRDDKPLKGRAYLLFSNQQALTQMMSLRRMWQRGERLPTGFARWGHVFSQLRDIRPWDARDRLAETGVLDDWKERLEQGQDFVLTEIELWFRDDEAKRVVAASRLTQLLTSLSGEVLHESVVKEIAYHGLLARVPASEVSAIVNRNDLSLQLVQCEDVQFFRATGQMVAITDTDAIAAEDPLPVLLSERESTPVIALLDGMPLQNHQRLAGRLIVDDPDGIEGSYRASERRHGTAMASLIIHGDLSAAEASLSRPIYVRPILQPHPSDFRRQRVEVAPETRLIVDLIHSAVRRIVRGEAGADPSAPTVCVVNLSIGIQDRQFSHALTPLARLLDWLSYEYKLLFVVSAGNHTEALPLGMSWDEFMRLSPEVRESVIFKSIAADNRHRRLISPAEAVNVLTVGAAHHDSAPGGAPPRFHDPYNSPGLPSPINAQGMGYRRSIKPEILASGGRVLIAENLNPNNRQSCIVHTTSLAPGHRAAAPGSTEGDNRATVFLRGTSNAAALTSRAAAVLNETLQDLKSEPGGELIDTIPTGLWLKALVVHTADWGPASDTLAGILRTPQNSQKFKEYLSRLLGFGFITPSNVEQCTESRVTALSGGKLSSDLARIHRLPLPPSLSGVHGWRRLTVTLAWFTPINPKHRGWRRAALRFEPPEQPLELRRSQADWQAATRGTIQHEILDGQKASAFVDGDALEIRVNCMADAGPLEVEIPYALAITLKVADELSIPVYNEVRTRVHAAQVRVTPAGE